MADGLRPWQQGCALVGAVDITSDSPYTPRYLTGALCLPGHRFLVVTIRAHSPDPLEFNAVSSAFGWGGCELAFREWARNTVEKWRIRDRVRVLTSRYGEPECQRFNS